jgi:hypothetical protein
MARWPVLLLVFGLILASVLVARSAWHTDTSERFTLSRSQIRHGHSQLATSGFTAISETVKQRHVDATLPEKGVDGLRNDVACWEWDCDIDGLRGREQTTGGKQLRAE